MARLSKDEREFCELGWKLIEWKVAYYRPEAVHESWGNKYDVADDLYDQSEVRYLELCRKLGHPNTIVHKSYPGFEDIDSSRAMMEVDVSRPSVQLVMQKLSSDRWKR